MSNAFLRARGIDLANPHIVPECRHNFSAKIVAEVMTEDLAKSLVIAAELFTGGVKAMASEDGPPRLTGVVAVMNRKSPPASRPGMPPGVRTGTLKRSFRARPTAKIGKFLVAAAGTNVDYARDLQFKKNRPFMEKSFQNIRPMIEERLLGTQARIRRKLGQRIKPL